MKNKKFVAILLLALSLMCIMAGCSSVKSTDYDVIKKTKMDNFTLLNESAKHDQIVMIGDSIIELYPTYELFVGDKIMYNRGISGDTSDKLLERLDANAINISPSVICILIGTNDLGKGLTADFTLNNISSMIDHIKLALPTTKIVIQSMYPVNKSLNKSMVGGRKNKDIAQRNTSIAKLCESKSVIYANIFDSLIDANGEFDAQYTYDGLHPNAKGFIEITKVLKPIIY